MKLTQFTKGGGCGCKLPPEKLSKILEGFRTSNTFGLFEGNQNFDDAAVIEISESEYLLATTDFFTPIVDDPKDFGRIAAANAISDIYAMGGTPILATSILAWPLYVLDESMASEVLKGATEICSEANIAIGGGHSISNPEPIFGLSVIGRVKKENLKRNHTAHLGDILVMTKALGSGILSTAMKRDLLDDQAKQNVVNQLSMLNSFGEKIAHLEGVHAMTDITGFGLLGHLTEMLKKNQLLASIKYDTIPMFEGVKNLAQKFIYPDNTMRNWNAYKDDVEGITGESLLTLCDPQTNGGLLIAVSPEALNEFEKIAGQYQQQFFIIGEITKNDAMKSINIKHS
jgi:selenide,water dikinase